MSLPAYNSVFPTRVHSYLLLGLRDGQTKRTIVKRVKLLLLYCLEENNCGLIVSLDNNYN